MSKVNITVTTALLLALVSLVLTRVFKAFTAAEVAAVLAFVTGITLWYLASGSRGFTGLVWPLRMIVVGSMLGLGGVVLKLAFVGLGIGVGEHDMAEHAAGDMSGGPNPLLEHIHHLFFNIGFLLFLIAAVGMGVRKLRGAS